MMSTTVVHQQPVKETCGTSNAFKIGYIAIPSSKCEESSLRTIEREEIR